jgi:hypothetical protein
VDQVIERIRAQAESESIRLTLHAHQEMVEEDYTLDDLFHALRACTLLEDYPEDRRGPSCLVLDYTETRRPVHVVCTTEQRMLIIITVYEPKPPGWTSPTERGRSR